MEIREARGDLIGAAAANTGKVFYESDPEVSEAIVRVLMEGRIKIINYFQEQTLCNNYHRYGNLGERALSNH